MSDGFPEMALASGEPFGYEAARDAFAEIATSPVDQIVRRLSRTVNHTAHGTPDDDVTFVVVRLRPVG